MNPLVWFVYKAALLRGHSHASEQARQITQYNTRRKAQLIRSCLIALERNQFQFGRIKFPTADRWAPRSARSL